MRDAILTFEQHFARLGADHRLVAAKNPSGTGDKTMPSDAVILRGAALEPRVNHGRWIVDCPDPDCGGAELVNFESGLFFCCECRNRRVGSGYLRVDLPGPMKRRDVEAYLRARPDRSTRNWIPSERVADLRDENRAHGITLIQEPKE